MTKRRLFLAFDFMVLLLTLGVSLMIMWASNIQNLQTQVTVQYVAPLPYTRDGDYIYFGEYPQTVKDDSVTVGTTADDDGYYLGSDGERYAMLTDAHYDSNSIFQDGTTPTRGQTYYFKVEPIKWKILSESDGTAFLFSEYIFNKLAYQPTHTSPGVGSTVYTTANGAPSGTYANNYKYSELRRWFNDDFYNKAFSSEEQEIIQTTTVDNSASTTKSSSNAYACENTEDKIFTLSYQDLINTSYGFNSDDSNYDTARQKSVSDYATSLGVIFQSKTFYPNKGYYWSRSPYPSATVVSFVYARGEFGVCGIIGPNGPCIGAAPALNLTL